MAKHRRQSRHTDTRLAIAIAALSLVTGALQLVQTVSNLVSHPNPTVVIEAPEWVKSSRSFANGECVEVAASRSGGGVAIRDTRNPKRLVLRFTPE